MYTIRELTITLGSTPIPDFIASLERDSAGGWHRDLEIDTQLTEREIIDTLKAMIKSLNKT